MKVCKACNGTGRKKVKKKVSVGVNILSPWWMSGTAYRIVWDVCKRCYGKGKI